jgi:uncharacterized protein (TIGR02246 family)
MTVNNIKSIIENGNTAWNSALNSGDIKSLAALYAEDATLSAGDGKTLVGKAAIEQLFNGFVENGVHHHGLEVVESGGSDKMIFQVTKWSANGAEADGKKSAFGGITMSVLQQNDDGKWLISAHVWNAGG